MVRWKKLHESQDLSSLYEKMSEAQLLAFSIGEAVNYQTLVILESKFKAEKIADLKEKFDKPSKVAEFIYKKFKGDYDAMSAFVEAFNEGTEVIDEEG